jgi:hypothetical protein
MNLPHYDFGDYDAGPLTDEMLTAALVVRLNYEVVTAEQELLVLKAAQILKIESEPVPYNYRILNQLADGILLAWPEP